MNHPYLLPALCCLLLPAVHADLATRRIPNWLPLTGCLGGLLFALLLQGAAGLAASLLAMLAAFALTFAFWLCGWLGASDVKLMTAVAACAGPALLPQILALTAAGCLVLALFALCWRGQIRPALVRLARLLRLVLLMPEPAVLMPAPRRPLRPPYALAIAAGSLGAVLRAGVGLPG